MCGLHNYTKKLASLCLRNGFIVETTVKCTQGTQSVYEYGSLGAEMRRNLRKLWWQEMVTSKGSVNGVELSSINLKSMESHSRPSIDCPDLPNNDVDLDPILTCNSLALEEHNSTNYPFHTSINITKLVKELLAFSKDVDLSKEDLLRQKIRKSILQNANCLSLRTKSDHITDGLDILCKTLHQGQNLSLPKGQAWISKYFTVPANANSTSRFIEEEILNMQFVCGEKTAQQWLNYWNRERLIWWRRFANVPSNFVFFDQHNHKSGVSSLVEIKHEFSEIDKIIESITYWTNIHSLGKKFTHITSDSGSAPHLLHFTANLEQGFTALLADAFQEKHLADSSGCISTRTVLNLHPSIAPIKVSVVLQNKDKSDLCEVSHQLSAELRQSGINTYCDDTSVPEDCYMYHDEIGTPYCVTILDTTLTNGIVAFRNRNTTLQEFMHISDVLKTVQKHLDV